MPLPELDDDQAPFEVAQSTPRYTSDQIRDGGGKPPPGGSPGGGAPPSGGKDLFEGTDTSGARGRKTMTPQERIDANARRKESIGRHRLWSVDVAPGTPEQWLELFQAASPTHKKWMLDLHEHLKKQGISGGINDPRVRSPKTPAEKAGAEDIYEMLKHMVPAWLGKADQRGRHGDKPSPLLDPADSKQERAPGYEPRPGHFTPPAGVGPKGGELKDFDDVIPMLGGRVQTAERAPEPDMGDDGGPAAV